MHISNPTRIPDAGNIEEFREPMASVNFIIPATRSVRSCSFVKIAGASLSRPNTCRRPRVILTYELPLAEMIYDLYDKLKSATRGYGTMDYEVLGFRAGDLCRLDILVAGQRVDALSSVVHRVHADRRGRKLVKKAQERNREASVRVAIQAAIGSRVIARESISAPAEKRHRQNVTAATSPGNANFSKSKRRARSV